MAADFDMNRGVARSEFALAADQRAALLDKDRDGRLARAELPPLPIPRSRRPGRDSDNPFVRPMGNSQSNREGNGCVLLLTCSRRRTPRSMPTES